MRRHAHTRRAGFTLLEVILTLGLTSLVLLTIGMAMDIHLRLLDSCSHDVEEAQLARTLLNRVADDLRSAILHDPLDADALLGGLPSGGSPSEGSGDEGEEEDASSEFADTGSADETDQVDTIAAQSVPGLYGNATMLQIDMSRLPRLDEYEGLLEATADNEILEEQACDVKTVTYYVISEDTNSAGYTSDNLTASTGLVRLEENRATASFEIDQLTTLDNRLLIAYDVEARPIAPEVVAIEFRYYDADLEDWVQEWDSDAMAALPMAVEIAIAMKPRDTRDQRSTSLRNNPTSLLTQQTEWTIYRQMVHLPMARLSEDTEMDEAYESAFGDSEGGSSGDTSSGSSGGMSAPSGGGGGGQPGGGR